MKRASISSAFAAVLLLTGTGAGAQAINDPTRPPAGFMAPPADEGAAARGPVLQSVKISRAGSSAIIGGETVKLGGKYRDARLVRISENEVVLRSASGTEILRMYPGVEIRPVVPEARAGTPLARKSRAPAKTLGKHE